MSSGCEDIKDCSVLQLLKKDFDNKIGTVTGQYEKVHDSLKGNAENMQKVTLAIALQTQSVEALAVSVKEYKSENEKDHDKLEIEDKALHTRITNVGAKQAKQTGLNESNVNWKELIKIAAVFAAVSAAFKYLAPMIGG